MLILRFGKQYMFHELVPHTQWDNHCVVKTMLSLQCLLKEVARLLYVRTHVPSISQWSKLSGTVTNLLGSHCPNLLKWCLFPMVHIALDQICLEILLQSIGVLEGITSILCQSLCKHGHLANHSRFVVW